jgi:hypothetical protein
MPSKSRELVVGCKALPIIRLRRLHCFTRGKGYGRIVKFPDIFAFEAVLFDSWVVAALGQSPPRGYSRAGAYQEVKNSSLQTGGNPVGVCRKNSSLHRDRAFLPKSLRRSGRACDQNSSLTTKPTPINKVACLTRMVSEKIAKVAKKAVAGRLMTRTWKFQVFSRFVAKSGGSFNASSCAATLSSTQAMEEVKT